MRASSIAHRRHRFAPITLLLAALLPVSPASAQSAGTPTGVPAATAPGTSFDGTWQRIGSAQQLAPVQGGSPPFTPAGRKQHRAHIAAMAKKDFSFDITTSRCSSPGLPRVMLAPGRMKVYARKDIVLMRFEWNRVFRQINLGKPREPYPADTPIRFNRGREELLFGTMMGKTSGHWDGAELVATSDGFSDKILLDNALPASEDLKVTERFRLVDQDTLEDRIRIDDPQNYTRPWETVVTYKRVADQAFPEDVCLDRLQAGEAAWLR